MDARALQVDPEDDTSRDDHPGVSNYEWPSHFAVETVTVRAMPPKPLGDRAMPPAERQRRRRARLAAERVHPVVRFAPTPELDRIRGNLVDDRRLHRLATLTGPETMAQYRPEFGRAVAAL